MSEVTHYLKHRFNEPSTKAALAGVLYVAGQAFPQYTVIANALAALLAGHAIVSPDPGAPDLKKRK